MSILTDLGFAQTVRGNTVYSISIISGEILIRKTLLSIRTLKLFTFLGSFSLCEIQRSDLSKPMKQAVD